MPGVELVLSDVLGTVKAREGDAVSLAGGMDGGMDNERRFIVCGEIVVTGKPPRPEAPIG